MSFSDSLDLLDPGNIPDPDDIRVSQLLYAFLHPASHIAEFVIHWKLVEQSWFQEANPAGVKENNKSST